MSLDNYVKAAVAKVIENLDRQGLKLKGKAYQLYESGYRPEMDVMEESDEAGVAKFQGFIGMFHWMVELGQMDIHTERSPSS